MRLLSANLHHTRHIAAAIAGCCLPVDCLLLRGDLGAGKTAFARGFISALCDAPGEMPSPTFSLVQTYITRTGIALSHFDLYRLKQAEEIVEIGLQEALQQSICLIEWPQIIEKYWPKDALLVDIAYGAHDEERIYTLHSQSGQWARRLEGLIP